MREIHILNVCIRVIEMVYEFDLRRRAVRHVPFGVHVFRPKGPANGSHQQNFMGVYGVV